jgi:hypothetical protein
VLDEVEGIEKLLVWLMFLLATLIDICISSFMLVITAATTGWTSIVSSFIVINAIFVDVHFEVPRSSLRDQLSAVFEVGVLYFLRRKSSEVPSLYLVFIPLPDASEVLSSHSEMDVAEEMREWKEEHRVTSVNGDELDHVGGFEVLVVPFIEVLIAIVNEYNFFSIQIIFILRFWWVQSVLDVLAIWA